MENRKPDEKSCGVVLFINNKGQRNYLLLHYPGGHVDFPKGHVEKFDKDEFATAQREVTEETGIQDIKFMPNFRHEVFYRYNKKGKPSFKQVVFFIGETQTKKVSISFEHKNFFWLPYNDAYKKLTFENAKNLLKEAEKYLENL